MKKAFGRLLIKSHEVVSSSSVTNYPSFSANTDSELFPFNFSYQIGGWLLT